MPICKNVDGMRPCSTCKVTKPLTKDNYHRRKGGWQGECRECKTRLRTQRDRERRLFVNAVKIVAGCADCGYRGHPAALQFDHLPGFKKTFNIGPNAERKSLKDIIAEIEKCDVVCANCHAVRTAERRQDERN